MDTNMEKGQFSLIEEFQLISEEGNEKNIKLPSGEHCCNYCYKQDQQRRLQWDDKNLRTGFLHSFKESPPRYPVITKKKQ